MTAPREDTLVALLYRHRWFSAEGTCHCGWNYRDEPPNGIGLHAEHVAAEVRAAGYLDPTADPVAVSALLTNDEHAAIRQAGDLWNTLCRVVVPGPTRDADLSEAIAHVHALQHTVMAQAAARAYPDLYRRLGGTLFLWNGDDS